MPDETKTNLNWSDIELLMYESLIVLTRVQERYLTAADGKKMYIGSPSVENVNEFFDETLVAIMAARASEPSKEQLMELVHKMDEASANVPRGSRKYGKALAERISQCANQIRRKAQEFPRICDLN